VLVTGDTVPEPDETFYLTISSVQNGVAGEAGLGLILDDDGGVRPAEISHGELRWADLASSAGAATPDLYLLHLPPRTPWEVTVDGAAGRTSAGDGKGPRLRRVANDLTTPMQEAVASGAGPARSLRLQNATQVPQDAYVQVASAGCSTDCGAGDAYRLRVRETTGFIPRFNNSGSQTSVLVVQNRAAGTISGTAHFWSAAGALLGSAPFILGPHAVSVVNGGLSGALAGLAGAITIVHDGAHGELAGKAVALEPATGFSFDTPMILRPQ
jgi:hypothetical protein